MMSNKKSKYLFKKYFKHRKITVSLHEMKSKNWDEDVFPVLQ